MEIRIECAGEIHPGLIRFRVETIPNHYYMFEIKKSLYEQFKAEKRLGSELKRIIYDQITIIVEDV